jgi:organic hydroperoxide reductase OsmC/OhrA
MVQRKLQNGGTMQTLYRVIAKVLNHTGNNALTDDYDVKLGESTALSDDAPKDIRPEEYICMGLAASFRRALKQALDKHKITARSLEVTVETTLFCNEKKQPRYEVAVIVCIGDMPRVKIEKLVQEAQKYCPVMLSMRRNVQISLHSNVL